MAFILCGQGKELEENDETLCRISSELFLLLLDDLQQFFF
jgi:hypothetical protein